MGKARNILFIMADQLRWDYLSVAGHPTLETPNIDRLAARGVMFSRAYCQAPVCGPSRMSFYTGRYTKCHGAHYNNIPLRIDELDSVLVLVLQICFHICAMTSTLDIR